MANLSIRIDFESAGSVGPGKIALLEAIAASGSIAAAARSLGMSYRRAWLILANLNESFDQKVASTATGGTRGGKCELTAFGAALVEAYRTIEMEAGKAAKPALRKLQLHAVKGAPRRPGA
jgi:molybdate transport system regulatory protein